MRTRKQQRAEEEPAPVSAVVIRRYPVVLPTQRQTETCAPKIVGPDGEHRVHVAVSRQRLVEGGEEEIVEVWVDVVHKEGAPMRGFAHALARLASLALQHGTPLPVVVRALVGTDGGPSGRVLDCDGVEKTTSIPDLVGRVLRVAGGLS